MVGRFALLACLVGAASAASPPGPIRVVRVAIERNGARAADVSSDETASFCRRFRLAPSSVRDFFARADRVDERAFQHDLNMSRCHAAGTLRLADGRTARWFIDRERRGAFTFKDGTSRYSYCLSCASPPFDEMDDETADTARALISAARR